MIEIRLEAGGDGGKAKVWQFPRITPALLTEHENLAKALRELRYIQDLDRRRDFQAWDLEEMRKRIRVKWEKMIEDPDTLEEAALYKAELIDLAEQIATVSTQPPEEAEAYAQAMANFVFESLRILQPDLTEETFEAELAEAQILLTIYRAGYESRRVGVDPPRATDAIIMQVAMDYMRAAAASTGPQSLPGSSLSSGASLDPLSVMDALSANSALPGLPTAASLSKGSGASRLTKSKSSPRKSGKKARRKPKAAG